MPQVIQVGLWLPPTGGVTEYLTGPGTWLCPSAPAAGPLWLLAGQPVVFGTTCAAGWATGVPPLTAGGMTSLLLLLPEGSAAMTIPVTAAAATTMAPMVIRLRRRSARRCWARIWAAFSRARCLFLAPLDISACLSSSRSPKEDRLPSQPMTQNPQQA